MIKLKKIPDNLSDDEHLANASAILNGEYDGLSLSYLGSDFGPVWSEDKHYDLAFLRHYRGMTALEVFLPGVECLEPIAEYLGSLTFLSLGEFNKKSISLKPLSGLSALQSLSLVRNRKDIEVVAGLEGLRDLSLTGYQVAQLETVSGLSNLEHLYLGFGTLSGLEPLSALGKLKSLDVLWVKGLKDLRVIEQLSSLECLGLSTLKQVESLPALAGLATLKSIVIDTLNGLASLSGIEGCRISELAIINSRLRADLFHSIPGSLPELARFLVSLSSSKEDAIVKSAVPPALLCDSLSEFCYRVDRRVRVAYCQ